MTGAPARGAPDQTTPVRPHPRREPGVPLRPGARGSGGFVVEKARQAWYDETTEMFREGLKAFFWTLAGVFLIVS